MTHLRSAAVAQLDVVTLYKILALRVDVFVVEQNCPYRELDGRDIEPGAKLVWLEDDGAVAATLRTLRDPDGTVRIGRVATARSHRGRGLAARLMTRAIDDNSGASFRLDAQAHLESWYGRFGFVRSGPDFDEDGIAHTPMARP